MDEVALIYAPDNMCSSLSVVGFRVQFISLVLDVLLYAMFRATSLTLLAIVIAVYPINIHVLYKDNLVRICNIHQTILLVTPFES